MSELILELAAEFSGVSIGDTTARLGIRFSREDIGIEAADKTFCGHRLDCEVVLGNDRDSGGQKTLVDDLDHRVAGSADVKRIGVLPDAISTGLTFSLEDIDIAELAKFSKGRGRLLVRGVGDIPVETKPEKSNVPASG